VPSASRELYYGDRFSSDYTKMKLENERLTADLETAHGDVKHFETLLRDCQRLRGEEYCKLTEDLATLRHENEKLRATLKYAEQEFEHVMWESDGVIHKIAEIALANIKPTAQKEAGNAGD
jgi:hypothetical protein